MLKTFATSRSKATKAFASVVSGAATTGVFSSIGIFVTHMGLVFVYGSKSYVVVEPVSSPLVGHLF